MPSVRVICPYCNSKLRISTETGTSVRASRKQWLRHCVVPHPRGPMNVERINQECSA